MMLVMTFNDFYKYSFEIDGVKYTGKILMWTLEEL